MPGKVGTATLSHRVSPGQLRSSSTLGIIHNKLLPRVSQVTVWVQGPHLTEPQHPRRCLACSRDSLNVC